MAYRYASNPSEAEDIAQEALLRAWRRRSTLRDSGSRKQWLSTIVRNEAFRHYSRPRPDPTDEVEQLESGGEELVVALKRAGGKARYLHHDTTSEDNWVGVIADIADWIHALA